MSTITLPGLSTGIDTASIISQLVAVESQSLTRYQEKETEYTDQLTALETIRDELETLQTATDALADSDDLSIYSATSSDTDVINVSADSDANTGSHTVEIEQLATTETWIQDDSDFTYETDYVGEGIFIYTYDGQSRSISTVADETTLEDLVNLINDDSSNPGVSASTLYYNGSYHLMLSGQDAGEDYTISVDSTYTEQWQTSSSLTEDGDSASTSTEIADLDQFEKNNGFEGDETITISGTNHYGTALADITIDVTADTTVGQIIDAINEQFDGVATAKLVDGEIWVSDNLSGESEFSISMTYDSGSGDTELTLPTLAVSQEGGGTPDVLDLGSFSKTQSAQSALLKVDGYPEEGTAEVQKLTFGSTLTAGTFNLTYNGITTEDIAYDATADEVEDAMIEDLGLTEGDITVSGDSSSGFTFTFLSSAGDTEMISIDASELTFSGTSTAYVTEEEKGSNGYIERSSNSISDVISGVTLTLSDVTEDDETIKITVSRNVTTLSDKIQSVVDAYNALMEDLIAQTEYDDETEEMGILSSNTAVSYIKSEFQQILTNIANGFSASSDSVVRASDIGITVDGDGLLEFDEDEFNDATDEDFACVLELLGATKTSSSESSVIQFYGASETYTQSGIYDVEVDIEDNEITAVRIKLSDEDDFRTTATWSDNLVTGSTEFDDGEAVDPENSLMFTVDLSQEDGTYTATISVKEGIMTELDTLIDEILDTDGRLDLAEDSLDDKIDEIEDDIEDETDRIADYQTRLEEKYARLEKTLTELQQQSSAVSMLASMYG